MAFLSASSPFLSPSLPRGRLCSSRPTTARRHRAATMSSAYDEDPDNRDSRYLSGGKGRLGGDPLAPRVESADLEMKVESGEKGLKVETVTYTDIETGEVKTMTKKEKKFSKSATNQYNLGFADAWAASGRSRYDVWFFIGLLTSRLHVLEWVALPAFKLTRVLV